MLFSFLFYKFVLAPVFFLHWTSKKIVSNGEGLDSASVTHSSSETVRLYLKLLVRYLGYFDLLPLLLATILVFNIFQSKTIWRISRMYR